jgi:interleukin enhancer-binding factor 2
MVRGGLRGGRNIRGGPRNNFNKKLFIPRHPFDMTLAEMAFPRVGAAAPDDTAFTNVSETHNSHIISKQ